MRAFTWSAFGFAFLLAGCAASEEAATEDTKSDKAECSSDDCCASLSRAAVLAKGAKAAEDASPIALKIVKFDGFMKDVQANTGKIVCAYLWSENHPASKKNLPLLLELQKKLGKDGVVFLTVSNDPAKASDKALLALKDAKCDLVNYRQHDDDTVDGWTNTFGCCGFPGLVVFNRAGKKSATFEVTELPLEAKVIETTLVKLLAIK